MGKQYLPVKYLRPPWDSSANSHHEAEFDWEAALHVIFNQNTNLTPCASTLGAIHNPTAYAVQTSIQTILRIMNLQNETLTMYNKVGGFGEEHLVYRPFYFSSRYLPLR